MQCVSVCLRVFLCVMHDIGMNPNLVVMLKYVLFGVYYRGVCVCVCVCVCVLPESSASWYTIQYLSLTFSLSHTHSLSVC